MTCSPGALAILSSKDGTGTQSHVAADVDDFISEDIAAVEAFVGGDFIRGTRSRDIKTVRKETIGVGGSIQIPWSYYASEKWSKRILGGGSTGSWVVAETLQAFHLRKYTPAGTSTNHDYINCKIASATIAGTRGAPIILDVQVVGTTETLSSATALVPTYTSADEYIPFILNDASLIINSVTYPFRSFSLTVDNFIETDFTNSLTATDNCPQDRMVTMSIDGKQGDLAALYALDYTEGHTVGLTITHSNSAETAFAITNGVLEKRTVTIPGRGTILLPLQITAYADKENGFKELVISTTAPSP